MSKKRKSYDRVHFKAMVALAAVANEETIAQLVSRFAVHSTMISTWKLQLLDSAGEIFDQNLKHRRKPSTSRGTAIPPRRDSTPSRPRIWNLKEQRN